MRNIRLKAGTNTYRVHGVHNSKLIKWKLTSKNGNMANITAVINGSKSTVCVPIEDIEYNSGKSDITIEQQIGRTIRPTWKEIDKLRAHNKELVNVVNEFMHEYSQVLTPELYEKFKRALANV